MNKISIFLIILIMSSVPFAFAHPYTDHAHLLTDGQEIKVHFVGLDEKVKVDDESIEFLSTTWFWQNFILLLSGVIVIIIACTVAIIYREKITN